MSPSTKVYRVRWSLTPTTFAGPWEERRAISPHDAAAYALERATALEILNPTSVFVQVDDGPDRLEVEMFPRRTWSLFPEQPR